MKNDRGKNILITVLILIIMVLITVIILVGTGHLNFFPSNTPLECTTTNDNNPYIIDLINDGIKQEWTYEGVTTENKKNLLQGAQPGIKLVLPKINIDSEGAKSINSKIENEYKEFINEIKNNVTEQNGKKVTYREANYNYTIRNNVIFLLIENIYSVINGSGSSYYKAYYYDIETGKELTIEEALNKLNISESYLKTKLNNLENLNEQYKTDLFSNIVVFPYGTNIKIMPKSGLLAGSYGETEYVHTEIKISEYSIWTHQTK